MRAVTTEITLVAKLTDGRELEATAEAEVIPEDGLQYDPRDPRHDPGGVDGEITFFLDPACGPEEDIQAGGEIPLHLISGDTYREAEEKLQEETPSAHSIREEQAHERADEIRQLRKDGEI